MSADGDRVTSENAQRAFGPVISAGTPKRKEPAGANSGGLFDFLEVWSGWVYAYRTFWLDPGSGWDDQMVANLIALGLRGAP